MGPIPGLWRFHLIYFFLAIVLMLAFFPISVYLSFIFIALICVGGLLLAYLHRHMASQIIALATGLGTPIVAVIRLELGTSIILFTALLTFIFFARDLLFFK